MSAAPDFRTRRAFSTGTRPLRFTTVPFTPPVGDWAKRAREAHAAVKVRINLFISEMFFVISSEVKKSTSL
jgi:hypothetical protein